MTRTIDFDAFRSEQKADPVTLVLGGKTYEMPASLPASLALDIVRLHDGTEEEDEVKIDDLLHLGAGLFGGDEKFRGVLDAGHVTMDELPDFMKLILDFYTNAVTPPNPEAQEPTPTSR